MYVLFYQSTVKSQPVQHRDIVLQEWKIGYEAAFEISSTPTGGKVAIRFMDLSKSTIVFSVAGRYNQKVVVLNTQVKGAWGREMCSKGYDFSSGIAVTIQVRSDSSGSASFKVLPKE